MEDKVLDFLRGLGSKVTVKKGESIIKEGEVSDCFFVIFSGSGKVSRKATELCLEDKYYFSGSLDQSFKVFEEGRVVGETGFFQGGDRTQTVTALEDSELLKVNYEDVRKLRINDPDNYVLIVLALSEHLAIRLRNSNRILVDDLLAEVVLTHKRQYFSNILLTLSLLGAFLLLTIDLWRHAYGALPPVGDTFLSCGVIVAVFLCLNVNKIKPPLRFFGLNLKNFNASVYDGIIYSFIMMFFGTIFKYVYIFDKSEFIKGSFFEESLSHSFLGMFLYFIFTILQELIARGIIQGAFAELFNKDKKGALQAIIISNILFASFHAIMFPLPSVAVILFVGLPLGWLYYKHKSLVAPVIAHTIVGIYGIWFLGLF